MKKLFLIALTIFASFANATGIESGVEDLPIRIARALSIDTDVRIEYHREIQSLAVGASQPASDTLCARVLIPNKKRSEAENGLLNNHGIESKWMVVFQECKKTPLVAIN